MIEHLEKYKNKHIRVITNDNRYWTGPMISISEDFLVIKDKYNREVSIKVSEVKTISEGRETENDRRKI